MEFLYSVFFGAGLTAFVYSRMSRRVGYGNEKSIIPVLAVIFVVSTIIFFTIFSFLPD